MHLPPRPSSDEVSNGPRGASWGLARAVAWASSADDFFLRSLAGGASLSGVAWGFFPRCPRAKRARVRRAAATRSDVSSSAAAASRIGPAWRRRQSGAARANEYFTLVLSILAGSVLDASGHSETTSA